MTDTTADSPLSGTVLFYSKPEPLSAELARTHNDANVVALGARLVGPDMAKACVEAFLGAGFAGGRHQRRVDQLSQLLQESD